MASALLSDTLISEAKSRKIAKEIIAIDSAFAVVVKESRLCAIGRTPSGETHFQSLTSSILSQQLSTKAAATILARVEERAGGALTAKNISRLTIEDLRNAGVSRAKGRSIKELSEVTLNKKVPINSLHTITEDEKIFAHLMPLFGIGKWTVEMFMIFQLGRLDIWPVGDLGVRRGWEKIHRLRNEVEPKKLDLLGQKFAPYRSYVAWYCWRATEL